MAQFAINQAVNFRRNAAVYANPATIVAVVALTNLPNIPVDIEQMYVIEHPSGWLPGTIRKEKFGLDPAKKYLFVKESELTAI